MTWLKISQYVAVMPRFADHEQGPCASWFMKQMLWGPRSSHQLSHEKESPGQQDRGFSQPGGGGGWGAGSTRPRRERSPEVVRPDVRQTAMACGSPQPLPLHGLLSAPSLGLP